MIYFDYNASAPLRQTAKDAIILAMDLVGNPSSVHSQGRIARRLIEDAREQIAKELNILPKRIIFTSGATEANNHIIRNFKGPVVFSMLEHDSITTARPNALICNTLPNGTIDLDHLEAVIQNLEKPFLVSLMAAHNETGIIQPVEKAYHLTKKYNGTFHCDAAQAIGRMQAPWHLFDYISLSGHKIGALSGVGALIVNEKIHLLPLITGGGQERSFRSGTENVLGIVSFGAVFKEAINQKWDHASKMISQIEDTLLNISPESIIIGQDQERILNTILISMPNVKSVTQVMFFDLHNICVSAGSACSSGKVKTSKTLTAMNISENIKDSTLRISISPDVSAEDVHSFLQCWKTLYEKGEVSK